MKARVLSIVVLLLMLVESACDTVSDTVEPEIYPVVYAPLQAAELAELEQELAVLSDNRVCNAITDLGFLSERFCSPSYPNPRITLTEEQAIARAKEELVKLGTFTHVSEVDQLVPVEAKALGQDNTEWRITFAPQEHAGYDVKSTDIIAFLYGDGIYLIYGHWYREVVIPEVVVSEEEAEQVLVGKELSFSTWSGLQQYEIVAEDIIGDLAKQIVVPYETEGTIELRVAWQIPIDMYEEKDVPIPEWNIYVDVVTGDVLEEKLLVIF